MRLFGLRHADPDETRGIRSDFLNGFLSGPTYDRAGRTPRPPFYRSLPGRMSQTSIERLRDYLAQLPPQAQALLMREFERALERGQDTAVATLVLDQLRKIVRKTEADAAPPPRTDDLSRLLFHVLEPFLVEAGAPIRVGQIRRSSLAPIWQWLGRDGAPDKVNEFEAALARMPADSGQVEALASNLQAVAAEAIFELTGPGGGDK